MKSSFVTVVEVRAGWHVTVMVISPRVANRLQIGLRKLAVLPILRACFILRHIHKMQR